MSVKEFIDFVYKGEFNNLYSIEYETKMRPIKHGLDVSKHRWYSTAVDVYKCSDGFVGVRGAYQSFSEQQDWEDIGITCEADEYKEVKTITYERK